MKQAALRPTNQGDEASAAATMTRACENEHHQLWMKASIDVGRLDLGGKTH